MKQQEAVDVKLVVVCTATGRLQALVMQRFLERAGIPVELAHELNVLVPYARRLDAQRLLFPDVRSGEIFCVPA